MYLHDNLGKYPPLLERSVRPSKTHYPMYSRNGRHSGGEKHRARVRCVMCVTQALATKHLDPLALTALTCPWPTLAGSGCGFAL